MEGTYHACTCALAEAIGGWILIWLEPEHHVCGTFPLKHERWYAGRTFECDFGFVPEEGICVPFVLDPPAECDADFGTTLASPRTLYAAAVCMRPEKTTVTTCRYVQCIVSSVMPFLPVLPSCVIHNSSPERSQCYGLSGSVLVLEGVLGVCRTDCCRW